VSHKQQLLPSFWWAIKEYIKTHNPPYLLLCFILLIGFPLVMYLVFVSSVFIGTSYTNYTFIPTLIDIYSRFGITEDFIVLLFNLFGIWARLVIISFIVVTLWYGLKHFWNRNKLTRINFKDVVALLSFVGAGFGFRMLMLFPWGL